MTYVYSNQIISLINKKQKHYSSQTWTGATCCKLDQWFVFHRLLMVTTWLLTMAGFILIFIELDLQWTAIPINENPHAVNSVVLLIKNPISDSNFHFTRTKKIVGNNVW